jgi:hypothetical protein
MVLYPSLRRWMDSGCKLMIGQPRAHYRKRQPIIWRGLLGWQRLQREVADDLEAS